MPIVFLVTYSVKMIVQHLTYTKHLFSHPCNLHKLYFNCNLTYITQSICLDKTSLTIGNSLKQIICFFVLFHDKNVRTFLPMYTMYIFFANHPFKYANLLYYFSNNAYV